MSRICTRTVFRCFKYLEKIGNKITGYVGPYFVGLAIILLSTGTVCFFEIIQPTLSYPFITTPICILIAFNLLVHYYYVCTVSPGFVDDPPAEVGHGIMWAKKKAVGVGVGNSGLLTGGDEGWVRITRAATTICRKCGQVKPERTHHCQICNRCVLKFDHHCPILSSYIDSSTSALGINQCVGIYNERHFVLFMAYLILSTFCLSLLGYSQMLRALGIAYPAEWPYLMPQLPFILIYILSVVLCLAVGVMCSWQVWSISVGETSVEGQDHDVYRNVAKSRGDTFVNSYDLGKWKNIKLFFNIGPNGYPIYTLIFPFRIMPYTDGRAWARREGYERHRGVREGEELTDDDDDDE